MVIEKKNLLANETSPYLRQHQHNPIWWYPWGEKALSDAKVEDKPIFLSVGYSTCHWCHVMEGDSFEKQDVADILNASFISIKVDREERPDVDAIYMTAVQALTHRGGWPMSVFLTPDGFPFWAGTFVPKQEFKYILKSISDLWNGSDRSRILKSSGDLTEYLKRMTEGSKDKSIAVDDEILRNYYRQIAAAFEPIKGGFSDAPKFPSAMHILALFRIFQRSKDKQALAMGLKTLDEMARGGLHDHLGGGFHRYSTDENWLVPHFEKMLYDNALLLLAYTEAFQITGHSDYERIVRSTVGYILRDLQAKNGGLFSAEDADSEKCEGKFYVWQEEELRSHLTHDEFSKIKEVYSTTAEGNFHVDTRVADLEKAAGMTEIHGGNVLFIPSECALPSENDSVLQTAQQKLLKIRSQRIRPLLDDKCITAWNGLGLAALAKAAACFTDALMLDAAIKIGNFCRDILMDETGRLCRHFCNGKKSGSGFLEDYAALIFGFIELNQASGNTVWLQSATLLQKHQDELFWDDTTDSYFDGNGQDPTIIIRTKDFSDNATPSGNSMAAYNLQRLGTLLGNMEWLERCNKLMHANSSGLKKYPKAYPMMMMTLSMAGGGLCELQVSSFASLKHSTAWNQLRRGYFPHVLTSEEKNRDPLDTEIKEPSFRVCRNQTCLKETTDLDSLLSSVSEINRLTL